ncbi:hypothetical protein, partial [Streptomyces sp. PU_AKi4]|uniref:hypothetical protein n=1 Tax=Streptomyces sp. PU_AKi4 TaxID=2800809 RepID=UPI003525B908
MPTGHRDAPENSKIPDRAELGHAPKTEELEPQSANRHSQRRAGGQSAPHKPVFRKRDGCD